MKLGAVHALADLSKEPVSEVVLMAYNLKKLSFGPDYFIPKPFDERLIVRVSVAVAKAAIESGVAKKTITDWQEYEEILIERIRKDDKLLRALQNKARLNPKQIALVNAEEYNVLKAAQILEQEGIAKPLLVGWRKDIEHAKNKYGIELEAPIIDPSEDSQRENRKKYIDFLWKKGERKGITRYQAERFVGERGYFAPLMVQMGDADALVIGFSKSFKTTLKPIQAVIETNDGRTLAGVTMVLMNKKSPIFLCDTSINEQTDARKLVEIARMVEEWVKSLAIEPRIAMVSTENFTNSTTISKKMVEAVKILHKENPEMIVDGELQPDVALNEDMLKYYPFSKLGQEPANVLIFPDQVSANISSKIIRGLKTAQTIGPILIGTEKPIHIMQMNSSVEEIVQLATMTVLDVQRRETKK